MNFYPFCIENALRETSPEISMRDIDFIILILFNEHAILRFFYFLKGIVARGNIIGVASVIRDEIKDSRNVRHKHSREMKCSICRSRNIIGNL